VATPTYISVTEGAGKKLAADTYQENGQVVLDQKVLIGEQYLPTYSIAPNSTTGIASDVANSHIFEIMAGASLNVRIRSFRIIATTMPAAATGVIFQVLRLSTAGTGGSALTPAPYDTADTAGATAMTLPSAKGTETTFLFAYEIGFPAALPVNNSYEWAWTPPINGKPIIIPAGTTHGICLKNLGAPVGSRVTFYVEIVETSF
jgi:hypothetical protein